MVVLPEHLHAVIRFPEGDADYSGRWRAIKGQFSHALAKAGVPLEQGRRGECRLWCRRFLGAQHPRRVRPGDPCPLRPLQPGQARLGDPGGRLALLVVPSLRPDGVGGP
jgi:hypothetical protein